MNHGRIIVAVTGVLLIVDLAVGLAVVATTESSRNEEAVCRTSECVNTAARILRDINPEVEPCVNFYNFACGGYLNSTPIPDGEISVSHFSTLAKDIDDQLKPIVEEPGSPDEARPFQLARTFYRTCMNTSALETAGLEPLREVLRQFGNWPVLEGDNWKEDDFNWAESVYKSKELGYSSNNFVSLSFGVDWTNFTRNMLSLDQPTFGLAREFLIEGTEYFVVKAYYDYMVEVAVLLGANKQQATRELRESLEFEINLANITLPDDARRNFTLLHNPMTVAQLRTRYPFVNWEEYINRLLPPSIRVDANEVVTVTEPNFITELERLLNNTPKRVQANYALWRVVAESVKYLNNDMRTSEMKYTAAMAGNNETTIEPRYKQCLAIIAGSSLSLSVNALYVRKHFKGNERHDAIEMVNDIRNELIKSLEKADWMDGETKRKAIEKTVSMISLVAYPVELLDDNELEKLYAGITLRPNDFLGNYLELKQLEHNYSFGLLRKPVNKTEWVTHDISTEVNAFYEATANSIHIPASVLQGTFFSSDRPRYMNYGALGFLIGHESTHAFDIQGRQFDEHGSLMDWWTSETEQQYLQKTQCIIDQYNNYTVESVGMNVDGANTVGENVADNGGVKNAYMAYKEYVKRNGPEPRLPGLEYTPEQMFWISAANIWCTRYRPESAGYELTTDVHSPERFRVIGPFANMPEFSADFNCPAGSLMNPVHKCPML